MPIHESNGITFLTSDALESCNIKHGFFMRHGGISPFPWKSLNMATSVGDSSENVIENRKRIADCLHINEYNFFDLWQVHGNKVMITEKPRARSEKHTQSDAIVTRKDNVALLMLFADCVPILFYEPDHHVIASAHAGWKGTINGIARETIRVMVKKFGCNTNNIISVIGPSICREHYQIGEEVASIVKSVFTPEEKVLDYRQGKIFLDLPGANKCILERLGVKMIDMMGVCTFCRNEDWFSHRGEGGKTGRFAAVISL